MFDEFWTVARDHQTCKQDALIRMPHFTHGADGWLNDLVHHGLAHLIGHNRRRGISTHAARVETRVAVTNPFMILGTGQC